MAKKRANGEGSIRKRKDGRWEGRYTAGHDPETGKAIIKNVLGRTQAEVKEKLKLALGNCERLDPVRAGKDTLGEWIEQWFEIYANYPVSAFSSAVKTSFCGQLLGQAIIQKTVTAVKSETNTEKDVMRQKCGKII